jgi:hypothetical protein
MQRNREKRPVTAGGRRSSRKNAVQIMNRLDRLVQLHVANIGGRAFVTSPTATQVLRFVTLIDATGREHPILVQCCASFEVSHAAWVRGCLLTTSVHVATSGDVEGSPGVRGS